MKRLLKILAISAAMACGAVYCLQPCTAKTTNKNATINQRDAELDELTPAQLMTSVPLGKYAEMICEFQRREALKLMNLKKGNHELYNKKDGFRIETIRNKEIVVVTIPTDMLFLPNDTELMHDSDKYLSPLKRFLKVPDMYRVVLIVHTDNTGSDEYTDQLALDRVDAVFNWFSAEGCNTKYMFPTASGATDPLYPNISGENRARNRRLEVYLIPGKEMLRQAKSGRIAL